MPFVVAFTGIRELDAASDSAILDTIEDVIGGWSPRELRFGGAIGADTVALRAAHEVRGQRETPRLVVYLPCTLRDVPREAAAALHLADRVVECGGSPRDRSAYLRRNDRMIDGADTVVGFTDGSTSGGTAYTLRRADDRGLAVVRVSVLRDHQHENPDFTDHRKLRDRVLAPVHAVAPYADPYAAALKAHKRGTATPAETRLLVDLLTPYLAEHFPRVKYLIPAPRQVPGMDASILPVLQAVSGKVLSRALWRDGQPLDGYVKAGRTRFTAEQHAASLRASPKLATARSDELLIVDDVLSTGGTALGAQLAVHRDAGLAVPVLALMYAVDFADKR